MGRSPDAKGFCGVVLLARRGIPQFTKAYGIANQELGVANTTTTKFRIGSMTKPFTATSIWMLQEQNKVLVSDRLDRNSPNFRHFGEG